MPPKRKASQVSVETPTKRRTRPRTVVPEEPTDPQVRVLRSTSISSSATEPRTPTTRRVTTTYGSTRKREVLAHSRKENEKDDEAAEAENSDDPLAYHPAENVETPRRARVPVARETKSNPAPSASKGKYTDYTININDDSSEDANSDDELMLSPATAPNTPSKRPSRKQPELLTPSPRKPQAPAVEIEVPLTSRRKARGAASPTKSSRSLPISGALPAHLTPCFHLQKRAMLRFLRSPMDLSKDEEEPSPNDIATEQLNTLLRATVERGEGNSCLVIGPRGSGKSHVVRSCLASLPQQPIVIHLSGLTEHNDRLAMREIARQLSEQTGQTYAVDDDADDANAADQEENPFLDTGTTGQDSIFLPPPSHLPALISSLPTLSRPTVVVLDAFDLFALHPRQALLYCLLDTVQSCRAGTDRSALAVVGMTSRIDTINHLEKRVKSRFSGRFLRTAHPKSANIGKQILDKLFNAPIVKDLEQSEEWTQAWGQGVKSMLDDPSLEDSLLEIFNISKDVRLLTRILTGLVLQLSPSSPFPTVSAFNNILSAQRMRLQYPGLHTLSYPCMCLLIAALHYRTAGHDSTTFEMLYDSFSTQVRASTAAPVQVNGGNIGMVRCSRAVMIGAFEELIAAKILVCVMPSVSTIVKQFLKYRCSIDYEDLRKAITKTGHAYLKRWMNKPQ